MYSLIILLEERIDDIDDNFDDLNKNASFDLNLMLESKILLFILILIISLFIVYPSILINLTSNLIIS